MAWNKLCISKLEGGLGFRSIDDFNSAILSKQLWRLITVTDSLFAKVFKGRYYRKSNSLENIKLYSPSYGWRSLCSTRSLVNKGLIKRVGSGASISVLGGSVDSLISALHLGTSTKEDTLGWHFTKSGKYTVKSGYHTARLEKLEDNSSFIGPEINVLKAHAWKVQCPPKLRHFLWQTLSGCVPVTENLQRRGINCDTGCVRCGAITETINHSLFQCHPARQI
ncbi:putative reverse transcriptase zinc-binding domain-containing protein [Arabidopsis thaliana]